MFGSKASKTERLERIVETINEHPNISPARIAALLGVPRSTIIRDLPRLEERGVLLQEGADGELSIFRRL